MSNVQILYPSDTDGINIHPYFKEEALCMQSRGFTVGINICQGMEKILQRGFMREASLIYQANKTCSWINTVEAFNKTLNMSSFLPIIKDWTFPSVMTHVLDQESISKALEELECSRVFIKNEFCSLFAVSDKASVFPDTPLETIKDNFTKQKLTGPFFIRKFINNPDIFYNEQRVWVINGHPFFTATNMPSFVFEAAQRLYEFSNSKYFTMDIAGEYIVEINPGESSDRGGFNPLNWFCDIFAQEFLKK